MSCLQKQKTKAQSSGCGKEREGDFSRKDRGAGSAGWCGGSRGPQRTHCVRLRSPPLQWPWSAEPRWRLRTPRSIHGMEEGTKDGHRLMTGVPRMKEARILILGVHGPRYKLGLLIGGCGHWGGLFAAALPPVTAHSLPATVWLFCFPGTVRASWKGCLLVILDFANPPSRTHSVGPCALPPTAVVVPG